MWPPSLADLELSPCPGPARPAFIMNPLVHNWHKNTLILLLPRAIY